MNIFSPTNCWNEHDDRNLTKFKKTKKVTPLTAKNKINYNSISLLEMWNI